MSEPVQIDRKPARLPAALHEQLLARFQPVALWLFGSRARGASGPGSDWDVVVVVKDRDEPLTDPVHGWRAAVSARDAGIASTILVTTESSLRSIWGLPNTIGYDLAREGLPVDVS